MNINTLFLLLIFCSGLNAQKLPQGFTYLKKEIPTLVVDLRYASIENFSGRRVDGYSSAEAVGTRAVAKALKKIQVQLKSKGLGLKLFDAYRPQRAVNDFLLWASIPSDTLKKQEYYPSLDKTLLFQLGYIASKSGHTRGSTIDVTLIYLDGKQSGEELDMGGNWDYFGEASHFNYMEISSKQMRNRILLRSLMVENGFIPYDKEWWHFSLKNEPFPNTYFDFITP